MKIAIHTGYNRKGLQISSEALRAKDYLSIFEPSDVRNNFILQPTTRNN
jgi:hypothetical protein